MNNIYKLFRSAYYLRILTKIIGNTILLAQDNSKLTDICLVKPSLVDVFELGRVAAANFGRGTGTDWNEVICNVDLTNIKVNVNVKVDNMVRGDY
jgi:hypothetical protein